MGVLFGERPMMWGELFRDGICLALCSVHSKSFRGLADRRVLGPAVGTGVGRAGMRRVVVTGMGVVSPIGVGVEAFWDSLRGGVGGGGPVSRFDASALPTRIAGEVRGFDPLAHLPRRDVVRTDAFIHYALTAAQEAIADAKLKIDGQGDRVGVSIGTGMGGIPWLIKAYETLVREG